MVAITRRRKNQSFVDLKMILTRNTGDSVYAERLGNVFKLNTLPDSICKMKLASIEEGSEVWVHGFMDLELMEISVTYIRKL